MTIGVLGAYLGAIALLGVTILLVVTLRVQWSVITNQLFEGKYFTLLRLHRDNVREIQLPNASGRKFFVEALRELRAIYPLAREAAEHCGQQLTPQQLLHVCYYCLFFGTGPHSSRQLKR